MDTHDTHAPAPPAPLRPPNSGSGAVFFWNDASIQSEAQHFPPDLREDYVWLKVFARDQCARDVDVLTERIRALGHGYDKTTVTKIIRGRWNRSASGAPLPHPIIKEEAFASLVRSLRENVRAEALRGRVPFVETSVTRAIFEYIDTKRTLDRVNKFGIVVGHTGLSKSATYSEYRRLHNHGVCNHIEAPESGQLGELVSIIGRAFGIGTQISVGRKRDAIFATLGAGDHKSRSARCLIVDNCQDLYRQHTQDQPALSFLRRLQDVTGCTIILSITPTFERLLMQQMIAGYFEQFEGRSGGRSTWLRLPEWPPDEDVVAIARAFGVEQAGKHSKELARIAHEPGRIRRLFEILQDAKLAAEADGAKVTIELIREIRGEAG